MLFESCGIRTVLDVGANAGQFGQFLREDVGFGGRIVSFEPLSGPYAELSRHAAADPQWTALNFALGAEESTAEINVSRNAYSSSILDILPAHTQAEPESAVISREKIQIKTLDSVVAAHCPSQEGVYLKIDTQGYEHPVLLGAARSLSWIRTLQLELSLTPLYQGQKLFGEMLEFLGEKGYRLVALDPAFTDPASGHLLQVDGIFHRA